MIINGGSRSGWRYFAWHLGRTDQNQRADAIDFRGLAADNFLDAFREMRALALGTRTKNFFYHANINPREDETLTPEQWEHAIDLLESNLGLEGHSRFVVEHEKNGRTHRHVVWSRIDPETLKAVSDSRNYAKHQTTSRELEKTFGHELVKGVHGREVDEPRPDRRPKGWEKQRGGKTKIDPDHVTAEITQLWNQADSGTAFVAALEQAGYMLAKGDGRDFVIIDQAGSIHSLARRIQGSRKKAVDARMEGIDREALPTAAEASALMKARSDNSAPTNFEKPIEADATPFEKHKHEATQVMKENGGELHPIPHAAPAMRGEKAAGASPFAQFITSVTELMRDESSGHPPMHDGLTWWERSLLLLEAAPVISAISQRVTEAALSYWQKYVDRSRSGVDSNQDREHEIER